MDLSAIPLFTLHTPKTSQIRGIISIPHSGENIPPEFTPFLVKNTALYREDVDFKVHELVDIPALTAEGIIVMVANYHRICIDLNRSKDLCFLAWKQNTQGEQLVVHEPSEQVRSELISKYYVPYFEILKNIIIDLEQKTKKPVSVIDLHSMPSRPTEYHFKQNPNQKLERMDFCLSDRKGLTCEADFIHFFADQLAFKNYSIAINDPYVGGYITEFVNQFKTNNIQIEINRRIYMDEKTKSLSPESQELRRNLTQVLIYGFRQFS